MFSDKEIEYIETQRLAKISTVTREGLQPDVVPVGFDFDGKECIFVGGFNLSKTKKYKNILGNEKVALVIDDLKSVDPWSPRGIKIYGTANIVARKAQGYLKGSGHASTEYIRIRLKKKWRWGINEPMFQ